MDTTQNNNQQNNAHQDKRMHRHSKISHALYIFHILLTICIIIGCSNPVKDCSNYNYPACVKACDQVVVDEYFQKSDDFDVCSMACDHGASGEYCNKACTLCASPSYSGSKHECSFVCGEGCFKTKDDIICKHAYNLGNLFGMDHFCEKGDNEACKKLKEYKDARAVEEANKKAKEQERINEELKCHITNWRIQDSALGSFSLSGMSWQNTPISLTSVECGVFKGYLGTVQSNAELDGKLSPSSQRQLSQMLLNCAKSIGNEKLREVAKDCNGKWF